MNKINQVMKIINKYNVYVDYGLTPNPFGFSYVKNEPMPPKTEKRLNDLLFDIECSKLLTKELRSRLY